MIDIPMWFQRIGRAEDLQNEKSEERRQILKLLTGTFFGKPTDIGDDFSEVNFVYEFLDVTVGSIYARNPHIFIRSRSGRKAAFAETMETVLNYYWWELKIKQKIKSTIINSVLTPPGFIGIGYTLLTEKNPDMIALEQQFPELKDNKKEKTEAERGILDETIREDDVFVENISPWDILWPDGYHDIRNSPYLIRRQKVTLVDILNNPNFKSVKNRLPQSKGIAQYKQQVKPYTVKSNFVGFPKNVVDDELIPVTLYHIWDKRTQMRFILAQGFLEDTLFEKKWNYLIDGFPLYPLIFNEIPATDEKANSYPLSDVVPMLPQLKELSLISSAMMRHRKRAGTLILAKEGSINPQEAVNIQKSKDIDLVFVKDLSEQSLKNVTPPSLPNDFYRMRDVILQDLMRVSGYNQLLGMSMGINTATESENVRAGALIRQSQKVDVIEDFTVDVARGLAALIWQFKQDKKEIEEIVGEVVNEDMWPTLPENEDEARKLIQKELQFRIDAGSTRPPKDEAVERKQWENTAGVIKANFPGRIKDDVFLKQWLKKLDVHDLENMIISYDDQETAIAQEENKLLMQGVKQLVSPNENDMIHLQVHSQVYQTPGLQPTKELDEHVDMHAKNMEMKSPKVNPQRGDSKISPQSGSPNQRRQGVPEAVDFLGAVNKMPGIGGNKGGGAR